MSPQQVHTIYGLHNFRRVSAVACRSKRPVEVAAADTSPAPTSGGAKLLHTG